MRFRWKSYDPKQLIWPLDAFAALPIPPAPLLNLFMPNKEHDASSGATVLLPAFIVCFSEPGAVSESSAHRTSAAAFFQVLGKRRFSCCCTHHLDQIWAERSSVENCLLEEETERCCCWGIFCTSCCFLDLKKWLSASQALVHGWCCQMGTYCCLLWVMTVLIFPTRAFVVPFVCAMDWPGYFTRTSPRGRESELWLTTQLTNRCLRCLQAPLGKMDSRLRARFKVKCVFVRF